MAKKLVKPHNGIKLIPALIALTALVIVLVIFGRNKAINVGMDRQFLWDDNIVDTQKTTASLIQHSPQPQQVVMAADKEWESRLSYATVLQHNDEYYMYYTAIDNDGNANICLAKSTDSENWIKPDLGIIYNGKLSNIVFDGDVNYFSAFEEDNSDKPFKFVIMKDGSLASFLSSDGLNWEKSGTILKKTENISGVSAFYNKADDKYYCYFVENGNINYVTSKDFSKWSGKNKADFNKSIKDFDISSVNLSSYYRQDGTVVGFPMRSEKISARDMLNNFGTEAESVISDALFVSSQSKNKINGMPQAFLTAGPQAGMNWTEDNFIVANGLIETDGIHSDDGGDRELSLFAVENGDTIRRYSQRIDGFASYSSGYNTTKLVTKPVKFSGDRLTINFSTSNAGYVFVRILDKNGRPFKTLSYANENGEEYEVPSYTSYQIFGDKVDREVAFNEDLSKLSGKTVVLEFYMSDADLYSFKFDDKEMENVEEWQPVEIPIRQFDAVSYNTDSVIDIGTERQLFVDDYIVDTAKTDAILTNHSPVRREKLFDTDLPWEGDNCDFYVIMDDTDSDGTIYHRMYYLGWNISDPTDIRVCYAYSYDGIEWKKPNLGLYSYTDKNTGQVYTDTNIMLYSEEDTFDNFFVMKNPDADAPVSQKYIAVAQGNYDQLGFPSYGLWAWSSPDGLHWTKTHRVLPQKDYWFGAFDSVNTVVWDEKNQKFFTYFRVRESQDVDGVDFIDFRKIYGAENQAFTPFDEDLIFALEYGENSPLFEMYTNNISKYYRAGELMIGFPTRFTRKVRWEKNYEYLTNPAERKNRYNGGQITRTLSMTETMLMTSRDGYLWNRQNEAWLTPGGEYNANWIYGNCYPAYGLVETRRNKQGRDNELSTYVFEGKYYQGRPTQMYRYSMRLDGFKSYYGDYATKKVVTKPLTFTGSEMILNFTTSAVGSVTVNIINEQGKIITSSQKLIGDNTDRKVVFDKDLTELSESPVTIEFELKDARIYSFKFQ